MGSNRNWLLALRVMLGIATLAIVVTVNPASLPAQDDLPDVLVGPLSEECQQELTTNTESVVTITIRTLDSCLKGIRTEGPESARPVCDRLIRKERSFKKLAAAKIAEQCVGELSLSRIESFINIMQCKSENMVDEIGFFDTPGLLRSAGLDLICGVVSECDDRFHVVGKGSNNDMEGCLPPLNWFPARNRAIVDAQGRANPRCPAVCPAVEIQRKDENCKCPNPPGDTVTCEVRVLYECEE